MKEKDYLQIAENIKRYRKLRGLTQEQMAYELDIDTQYYAQLEQGRRRFTLEKIIDCCNILSIRIDDIIVSDRSDDNDHDELIRLIDEKLKSSSAKQLSIINEFIERIIPFV